jgi:hypothetical protein
MEWTISFLAEQQVAVIQTRGVADEAGSLEMAKDIIKCMGQYNTARLLIDHSELRAVSGKTINVYYRSQELRSMGVPVKVKIAEVILPAHREHFGFLETVCRNRGVDFAIFDDRESAMHWLGE